jgi:hypothetical protein
MTELLMENEFALLELMAIPFAKPRMTVSSTLRAAPELNRIPVAPVPPPSISNPRKLTTSFTPALIVIPFIFVARTPVMPWAPMIVTDWVIVTAP